MICWVPIVSAFHDDTDASIEETVKDSNFYFIVICVILRIWMFKKKRHSARIKIPQTENFFIINFRAIQVGSYTVFVDR